MRLLVLLGVILVTVVLAASYIDSFAAKAQTKACPADNQVNGQCIKF